MIQKVATEVRVSSEAQLTSVLTDEIKELWDLFREKLLEFSNTSIHSTQNYVSVKYEGTALINIRFRKKELSCEMIRGNVYPDGKVRKRFFEIDDPKNVIQTVPMLATAYQSQSLLIVFKNHSHCMT